MQWSCNLMLLSLILWSPIVVGAECEMVLSAPQATAADVGVPVGIPLNLSEIPNAHRQGSNFGLLDTASDRPTSPVPVQFEPATPDSPLGTAWCFLADAEGKERRLRVVPCPTEENEWRLAKDEARQAVELWEGDHRVLRYNHGSVPVREGTHAHFAAGESYERGDYIHPLYGPSGEELTEDYPRDHPHHRGVWWSWPVTRWNDQLADIWAVVGVWSRPDEITRLEAGPVFALLEASSTWKFGKDETPIVTQQMKIRAFRQQRHHRVIDVELRLTALADGVSIGGRPKAGYGGFALRAAPCTDRQIACFTDPEDTQPRRAWIDYSGRFPAGQGMSGVTILEHVSNPDYPNPLHEYPQCNCVMPAYPDKREVALSRDVPLVLKHRLWIHPGDPAQETLAKVWASYAHAIRATISK